MATIEADEIEAKARAILRARIEGSPWYPNLSEEDRAERIAQDVECYWPTMVHEGARRLVNRFAAKQADSRH